MKWLLLIGLLYGKNLENFLPANIVVFSTLELCEKAKANPMVQLEYNQHDLHCVPWINTKGVKEE
jgi:hypothetical protein